MKLRDWLDTLDYRTNRFLVFMPFGQLVGRLLADVSPLNRIEAERLKANGAKPYTIKIARRATSLYMFANLCVFTFFYVGFFLLASRTAPSSDPKFVAAINSLSKLSWFPGSYAIFGVLAISARLSFQFARREADLRIYLHVTQIVRLLDAWDEVDGTDDLMQRSWRRQVAVTRRKLRRLAWEVSRDCTLLAGLGRSDMRKYGMDASGKILLWVAQRPWDARRRALAWEMVVDLCDFVRDPVANRPVLLTVAAGRFDVAAAWPRRITIALELLKAPLVIGLLVALATAILRKGLP